MGTARNCSVSTSNATTQKEAQTEATQSPCMGVEEEASSAGAFARAVGGRLRPSRRRRSSPLVSQGSRSRFNIYKSLYVAEQLLDGALERVVAEQRAAERRVAQLREELVQLAELVGGGGARRRPRRRARQVAVGTLAR